MYIEANAVSLERTIAIARDAAFVFTSLFSLVVLGWKGKSWFQPILNFFKRANGHMDKVEAGLATMENGMKTLLDNHMGHVQRHLETLAGAKVEQDAVRKQSATRVSTRPSRKTRRNKTR